MRFKDRRALVTGASSGVGRAVAVLLASEGAHLTIHYHKDAESAEKTATACGMASGTVPAVIRADLSDWDEGKRTVEDAATAMGGLDILICNAGHNDTKAFRVPLDEIGPELWDMVLATDLRGAFTTAQAAGRLMRQQRSSIVLVGSTPALVGARRGIPHAVAKAGVLALTRVLARDLAPKVRVNAVALGAIATRWLDGLSEDEREGLVDRLPLHRVGRPEDAARAILYLASDDATFVTGQTLVVDGGQIMR
ncbi:SDR family NAD(P)-dependent oxidoreductase [Planctomycetota bacterium]